MNPGLIRRSQRSSPDPCGRPHGERGQTGIFQSQAQPEDLGTGIEIGRGERSPEFCGAKGSGIKGRIGAEAGRVKQKGIV